MPFIRACENEIPEIESVAFQFRSITLNAVTVNNTVFSVDKGAYVNKNWLEMFHNQIVDGSFEAFGAHPYSVVLSEAEARKFFGDNRAVGQTIRFNDADYMVQAVVRENPSNSSFRFHFMASTDAAMADPNHRHNLDFFGSMNWEAFVKFRPDTDVSLVIQKMDDIFERNLFTIPNVETKMTSNLELLTNMYFSDVASVFISGNAKMVSIFALLGILILCTACVNYINLTTARVTQRAKEVGIKKIVGAKSGMLFLQFIAESFILSLMAAFVAIYLIVAITPLFQQLVGDIPVSFLSPTIWIITAIVLVFATILNGIYPALVLSSFQPINTLKGKSLPKIKDSSLRRVLVVFQFTLSAALIISVIVIFLQTQFIINTDPGFNRDNIVRIQAPFRALMADGTENAILNMQTIKGKLQSNPNIINVSLSGENIENIYSKNGWQGADWEGRTGEYFPDYYSLPVDEDFLNVFELQLVAGRWFDNAADMQNVILNETAIREYGILEPYIGQRFDERNRKGNIIGIAKDFPFKSRHEKIAPLVIYQGNFLLNNLSIKFHEGKTAEVVSEIETIWNEFFPHYQFEYTFIDDAFNHLYQSDIRTSRLILVFSILAVVIAVLGLFGLSTFAIERRTKEIGIRKVLGASSLSIVQLLTREFFILAAIAFIIAAPVSWWAMRGWLENFAYRINITVWVFVAAAVVTVVFTVVAVGAQALRAAMANPVEAIKGE